MQRADITNSKVIGDSYSTPKFANIRHGKQIDEMLNRDRQINPHWHSFIQALDTLGLPEMESRHAEVQRLLRENGGHLRRTRRTARASPVGIGSHPTDYLEYGLGSYLCWTVTACGTAKPHLEGPLWGKNAN